MTDDADAIPAKPGCYVFCLEAVTPGGIVRVGRCGELRLIPGEYLYVGSAHGPGGLRARIRHHLQQITRPHWHLDYLRPSCRLLRVGFAHVAREAECRWAGRLQSLAQMPLKGFGASDCRCSAHLFHTPRQMELRETLFSSSFRWVTA